MKCHDARRRLDLFMDGELSVAENLSVLEHLNLCRPCASVYEGEKALRGVLKERVGSERAPAGFADRLSRSLGGDVVNFPRRRPWGMLAAALFFFTFVGTMVFTPSAELPQALAATVSAQHERTCQGYCGANRDDCICVCGGCGGGDAESLRKFFDRHGCGDACLHDLKDLGYTFLGASVWSHRGEKVCWTVQRDGRGRAVTHALVRSPVAMESRPLRRDVENGRVVVFVPRSPGLTCVFIFDAAEAADGFLAHVKMK